MGSFAILMYDLQTDNLHQMKDHDQAAIRQQMSAQKQRRSSVRDDYGEQHSQLQTNCTSFEQVDSIRFLKTNVGFYERAVLVWFKYKLLNEERLRTAPKTEQFALLQDFTHFLRGFLAKESESWTGHAQQGDSLLGQATELIASIILKQHFSSVQQFENDFHVSEMDQQMD